MTFKREYDPSQGFFFHGPYESILSLPETAPPRLDMYLDPAYSSYAHTEADALVLAESRWQAEQHSAAIDAVMDEAYKRKTMAPAIGDLMVTKILDYYYFWPLEPTQQISQIQAANKVVERIKHRDRKSVV